MRSIICVLLVLLSATICQAEQSFVAPVESPAVLYVGLQSGFSFVAINELQTQLAISNLPELPAAQFQAGCQVSCQYSGWRAGIEYLHTIGANSSGILQNTSYTVAFANAKISLLLDYDIPLSHDFVCALGYKFSWNNYTIDLSGFLSPKDLRTTLPVGQIEPFIPTDWDYMWVSFRNNTAPTSNAQTALVKNSNISFSPQIALFWQVGDHLAVQSSIEYAINASPHKHWAQKSDPSFLLSGGEAGMTMNTLTVLLGIHYTYAL